MPHGGHCADTHLQVGCVWNTACRCAWHAAWGPCLVDEGVSSVHYMQGPPNKRLMPRKLCTQAAQQEQDVAHDGDTAAGKSVRCRGGRQGCGGAPAPGAAVAALPQTTAGPCLCIPANPRGSSGGDSGTGYSQPAAAAQQGLCSLSRPVVILGSELWFGVLSNCRIPMMSCQKCLLHLRDCLTRIGCQYLIGVTMDYCPACSFL